MAEILSVWVAAPTTCNCGEPASDTAMAASAPESAMLLATPTLTSNSSPGATTSGALGDSTKSPRTMAARSAVPMADSLTATAMMRSRPLK
jgi:hypothetical protein